MNVPRHLPLTDFLNRLRSFDGPLTRKLELESGPLGKLPAHAKPDSVTQSICGFCSTGCALEIHRRNGEATNLSPASDYPVNTGMACPKGWEALTPLKSTDRATTPLLRNARGELKPVDWDMAMRTFVERTRDVQSRHGEAVMAFLSTGQIMTEEMALLGAVAKFGFGMVHGDGNTRQCMATAVTAYKESFGFDAPPYTYADFEESDVIVLVGSNLCIAHPILWQRILQNRRKPEIIVIDPRRTETAMAATRHLAIRPKSDLTFFYGVAKALLDRGAVDHDFVRNHTEGFEAFAEFLEDYPGDRAIAASGIDAGTFEWLVELLGSGKRVSLWWTMGVNQGHEATRTAQALINIALMTGNIGKPGTGANSITGQCNAMGSRLFSNTTNLMGGHDFTRPEDRAKVAGILGIDEARIPRQPSWAYDQIIDAIETGEIRGLWVIATNPAHSWMHQNRLHELREKLDFLVVQDMYTTTETAQLADLVLPAAGWGEKEGTFINSERRFGVVRPVAKAPGEALSDFRIFRLVAEYAGFGHLFRRWASPEAVFEIMQELSEGQPCDITGISGYGILEESGGIQWPLPRAGSAEVHRRLFEDGQFFTVNRKARFIYEQPRATREQPDASYPFVLLTGRGTSAQWHTQTRTGKSAILRKLYPAECYIEMHPEDVRELGIAPEQQVVVRSRRGELRARAIPAPTMQRGQVFLPMHYREVNRLTLAEVDPYSRQPAYKHCAVRVGAA